MGRGRTAARRETSRSDARQPELPLVEGGEWPASVTFLADYVWSQDVRPELLTLYAGSRASRRDDRAYDAPRPLPCPLVRVRAITDPAHPACGQFGLYAAQALQHGQHVLDYLGVVSEVEDRTSDYVVDFGEHSELALDALSMGNEGRFVNDYRNTGRHANVEFRIRRGERGELRQGVYVCAKQVREGEELLISYGRNYWKSRVGPDLEAFIYRRPGE